MVYKEIGDAAEKNDAGNNGNDPLAELFEVRGIFFEKR
jgi:hypothetical protein